MDCERWLPIPGLENRYEVSDKGRVRSVPREVVDDLGRTRRLRGVLLKPVVSGNGDYLTVSIDRRSRYIHHLVLEAFVGARPAAMECCHRNDDGYDNRLVNLRWDTRQANVDDYMARGRHPQGRKTRCKRGHPFDEKNTYRWVNPATGAASRICKACAAQRARRKTNTRTPVRSTH